VHYPSEWQDGQPGLKSPGSKRVSGSLFPPYSLPQPDTVAELSLDCDQIPTILWYNQVDTRPGGLLVTRVLIVDVDREAHDQLSRALSFTGALVFGASGRDTALHQIKIVEPDLIILDISSPDSDRWETLGDPQAALHPRHCAHNSGRRWLGSPELMVWRRLFDDQARARPGTTGTYSCPAAAGPKSGTPHSRGLIHFHL
jgi:hypothetical protein